MRWCPVLFVTFGCAALTSSLHGQQVERFDHGECRATMKPTAAECTPVRSVTAQPGEQISLIIGNTCPDLFNYEIVRVPKAQEVESLADTTPVTCEKSHIISVTHDDAYGGYIVHITKKAEAVKKATNVGNAVVTIAVETSEWEVGFSGGFAIHSNRDEIFALRDIGSSDDGSKQYEIEKQNEQRDDIGKGVASFVHVHHSGWEGPKWGTLGITFGLGLSSDGSGDYYFGPSWLLGDRAAITGGFVVSRVATLPRGRSVGDTIQDANALATLGTRWQRGIFLGLSYRFLGDGAGRLAKPFAGQGTPPADPKISAIPAAEFPTGMARPKGGGIVPRPASSSADPPE